MPAFRPDSVVDPEFAGFSQSILKLGEQNGEDASTWSGYLNALRKARLRFKSLGCTSTDHGHLTAETADLPLSEATELFNKVFSGKADKRQQVLFQAQMLTEMAQMSLEDGLVMQIHPGSTRNHNHKVYEKYGRDVGCDIPRPTNYVDALRPLLNRFGNESKLTLILFTQVTETAGFYNTVGFNDDTRAFLSIPARHDVARRIDCAFLARLVAEHRLDEDEAFEVAYELTYGLVKKAYKL